MAVIENILGHDWLTNAIYLNLADTAIIEEYEPKLQYWFVRKPRDTRSNS